MQFGKIIKSQANIPVAARQRVYRGLHNVFRGRSSFNDAVDKTCVLFIKMMPAFTSGAIPNLYINKAQERFWSGNAKAKGVVDSMYLTVIAAKCLLYEI